jgi:hypothetical protein
MNGRYHAALVELLRAAEADELSTTDLEALAQATDKRLDLEATVKSGMSFVSKSELGRGFLRALRRAMN